MRLQQRIKDDLKTAMKTKNEVQKDTIRVIMGEFARSDKKEISDEEVIGILKKLIKSEQEVLERRGGSQKSEFIDIVEAYLPRQASDDEIEAWIKTNIDLTAFNNKMQAMKPIMAHFGSTADGNTVKRILQSM